MSVSRRFRFRRVAAGVAIVAGLAGGFSSFGASAAGTSSISGAVFQDMNRNGVRDAGEAGFGGHQLYLFDGAGTYLAQTSTDSTGRYAFSGLADGGHLVRYSSMSWSALRDTWVPTTTGSVQPQIELTVQGTTSASFGWRPMTTSPTAGSPVSAYTDAAGVRYEIYNDGVAAADVASMLQKGSLVGGKESTTVVVRVALSSMNTTTTSYSQSGSTYYDFLAVVDVSWASFLDQGDVILFHEYGHAWSLYNAVITQQDPSLAGYIQARGLTGDTRLNSSYQWSVREMIAEDYRQIFGTAATGATPQANTEIPLAKDVPGLADYLSGAFLAAPTSSTSMTTTTTLAVSGVSMNPSPVVKSGTASFSLTTPAAVTVTILDSRNKVIRTLAKDLPAGSGTTSLGWDRLTDAGRKAGRGTYTLVVSATQSGGDPVRATAAFSCS